METEGAKSETWLLAQVRSILKCDSADPQDDFLALGGDSFTAPVLVNRIEAEFGFRPALEDIFTRPLGELAEIIADGGRRAKAHDQIG